jgi:hypothetical protein
MPAIGLSLKSYSVELADYLGITPLAVYERQRALVRLGVLESIEGRGPHSGVRATPNAVAVLLIGALLADNLSEIDQRVVRLLNAKPTEMERSLDKHATQRALIESAARQWREMGSKSVVRTMPPEPAKVRCPITGASNFRNAVAALLSSEALASEVESLTINRSLLLGIISARDERVSQFGTAKSKKHRMEIEARFPGELLAQIAGELPVLSTVEEKSS